MSPDEKNLFDQRIKAILTEKSGILANIDIAKSKLTLLSQLLDTYKGTVSQYIESKAKVAGIQANYKTSNLGSSYGLPGVFSKSTGSYDIEELRKVGAENQKAVDTLNLVEAGKDNAYKQIVGDVNSVLHCLRQVSLANDRVEQSFFEVEDSLDKS